MVMLNYKQFKTYGCVHSIVVTDAAQLKHLAISIHHVDIEQHNSINSLWLVTPFGDIDLGQHWLR